MLKRCVLPFFLRKKYGDVVVRVDYGKKENRARPADDLTLAEFLAIYNDSDRYLVDTLPQEMWDEFYLPKCLLCGGFTSRLQVRNYLGPCFHARFECSSGVHYKHHNPALGRGNLGGWGGVVHIAKRVSDLRKQQFNTPKGSYILMDISLPPPPK